jgi:acyl-CoA thioesterase-1
MPGILNTLLLLGLLLCGAEVQSSEGGKWEKKTILVLGDSIAAGYGLDLSEAFPALLEKKMLEAGFQGEVVNAGISGDTSAGGLRRIDWQLKRKIDVLILELGGNDGLRGLSIEQTRTNLQGIIDRVKIKNSKTQIVIAGMQIPRNMGVEYTSAFQKIFSELAEKNGAVLVPFLLEGVAGKPELNLPDMIHPTAKGHQIVSENVWKVLEKVLKKNGAS